MHPGPQSYHAQDGATIHIDSGVVQSITDDHGQPLSSYELEPLLITGLSEDANRTKRRLLTYDEIPPNLVQAVLAIEDRRFFEHSGVNYYSMISWGWHDVIGDRKHRGGASTLTMQLAKLLFLSDNGTIKYKLIQIMVAFQLEHRFTKQQIFEMYANQINLGQRGSFSIDGFGEAAQAYFGKDVRQLDLAECAMLAGIIQRPNYFNPFRHPDRTIERRNLVLDSMVETGAITKEQAERAKAEPLHLSEASVDASEAPYFVDLVHEQLLQKLGERDFNREGLRIYTSLDPDLQRAATGRRVHHSLVDEQMDKAARQGQEARQTLDLSAGGAGGAQSAHRPGACAGRRTQLRHIAGESRRRASAHGLHLQAVCLRGRIPDRRRRHHAARPDKVVFAGDHAERRAETYGEGTPYEYTPRNFEGEFYGEMTARFALMRSDNNATISLASMVGFDRVAALAREAGIKSARGTPSMAIGSYDATPLDMAGAYTVFANGGLHLDPWMLASVRTPNGDIITDYTPTAKQVLDPRVAYLTTNMLRSGAPRQGNRRRCPQHGIHRSGSRQNRHRPRRMVCRLHQQSDLHCVGGQRRLHLLDPENRGASKVRMSPRPSGPTS